MTQTATQTAASIDIINARLPGDDNLQQILIREGKIVGIEPGKGQQATGNGQEARGNRQGATGNGQ